MTRKGGQGSRKSSDLGVRLFGVQLTKGVMRKSISMGNLSNYPGNGNQGISAVERSESGVAADGYLSDGIVQESGNCRERRKGVPWTEEEHRLFLIGLQKLGKGDWRGIARNFVTTRTATQVASHAQKYFIRQSNSNKKKRRSSLFDILPETDSCLLEDQKADISDMSPPLSQLSLGQGSSSSPVQFTEHDQFPASQLPLASSCFISKVMAPIPEPLPFFQDAADCSFTGAAKYADNGVPTTIEAVNVELSSLVSSSPHPESFILWLPLPSPQSSIQNSNVVKPKATVSSAPLAIDHPSETPELVLSMTLDSSFKPSPLSSKLNQPSRSSAFHVKHTFRGNGSLSGDNLNKPISVV